MSGKELTEHCRMSGDVLSIQSIMERYFNILSNQHEPASIEATCLNDLILKHGKDGLVCLSAYHTEESAKTNMTNTQKLFQMVRKSPFRYLPIYTKFHGATDTNPLDYIPAIIVFNELCKYEEGTFEDLKQFAQETCQTFGQGYLIIKEPMDICNGSTISTKHLQLMFQQLAGKNHIDSNTIYVNPTFCTLNERMRRCFWGEIVS